MEFTFMIIVGIFLSWNVKSAHADYPKPDELTLRNQLLADVYFLKEGVDRLLVSSEVLNKRFNNQMDILKSLRENSKSDGNFDSAEDKNNCDKITGMFNVTLRKQNIFENRLFVKLDELQDDQMMRFEEMLLKQKLTKNCNPPTQSSSSSTVALLSNTLTEISEKIDQFEEKITKLSLLDELIKSQEKKLDNFAENQMKILQQINDKLSQNYEQFDKIKRKLTDIKELNTDCKKIATRPRKKLPMEAILGLTSANITGLSKNFKTLQN